MSKDKKVCIKNFKVIHTRNIISYFFVNFINKYNHFHQHLMLILIKKIIYCSGEKFQIGNSN